MNNEIGAATAKVSLRQAWDRKSSSGTRSGDGGVVDA
jgi:hypothetical protein